MQPERTNDVLESRDHSTSYRLGRRGFLAAAAATATAAAVHENGRFDVSYDDDTLEPNVKWGKDLRPAALAPIALATAAEEPYAKRARAAQD